MDMCEPEKNESNQLQQNFEIRYMIEEMTHQLQMLEISQLAIENELKINPGDIDFVEAFEENFSIIIRKKTKILELERFLTMVDPAFRGEGVQLDHAQRLSGIQMYANTPSNVELYPRLADSSVTNADAGISL